MQTPLESSSEVAETPIPDEVIHLMEDLDSTPLDFSQIRWCSIRFTLAWLYRMKALAISYMWWPGIDKEMEHYRKECPSTRKDPLPLPLHPWSLPGKLGSRINYAGLMEGKMFLLIVNALSRWIEVQFTTSATSSVTIELLRKSFATMATQSPHIR